MFRPVFLLWLALILALAFHSSAGPTILIPPPCTAEQRAKCHCIC